MNHAGCSDTSGTQRNRGRVSNRSGVPILRLGDTLIVSVPESLHDRLALALQEDITLALSHYSATGLLIDVSVIDVVDSFMGRIINDIAAIGRLMGAYTALVGIQPAVAITLIELGTELRGVLTALNIEQGLERLKAAQAADQASLSDPDIKRPQLLQGYAYD